MAELDYAQRDLPMLTDKQRAAWAAYARRCADVMRLKDWDVHIASSPAEEGYVAQEQCTYGQRSIVLFLSDRFLRSSPEQQRLTIAHELAHAIARPVEYLTHVTFANDTKERLTLFHALHKEAMEHVVEHFAQVVAPSLPLPEGP